ncbi:MAG: hypothetical protein DBW72_02750 [Flavobacteriales bacterium]|nr:MAG: hypothetical protein DBW72_02750 [Flavobacteriales bacterium]
MNIRGKDIHKVLIYYVKLLSNNLINGIDFFSILYSIKLMHNWEYFTRTEISFFTNNCSYKQ